MPDNYLGMNTYTRQEEIESSSPEIQRKTGADPKVYLEPFIKDFTKAEKAVAHLHTRWQWYLMMYRGEQFAELNSASKKIEIAAVPPHRVRIAYNRIQSLVTKSIAKAKRFAVRYMVIPPEPKDKEVCSAATKQLHAIQMRPATREKKLEKDLYIRLYGTAFGLIFWNNELGREVPQSEMFVDPITGEVREEYVLDKETGEPIMGYEGDVDFEILSPFYVFPNPEIEKWRDMDKVHTIAFMDVDQVKMKYADVDGIEEVKPDSDLSIKKLSSMPTNKEIIVDDKPENTVMVYTGYYKPSYRYPAGKRITYVTSPHLVLEDVPMKRFPIVKWEFQKNDGAVWGMGMVEHIARPQQEYNKTRSQQIEIKNLMAKPKWLAPKNAGLAKESITTEAGEIIGYNHPFKPEMVTPPGISNVFPMELERTIVDMQDITYIHDVSQGRMPTGARSGKAVMQLQEQDDEFLALVMENDSLVYRELYEVMLELMQDNYPVERIVTIIGEHNEVEAIKFKAADLKNVNWNLQVIGAEQLPLSPMARLEVVLELIQYQVLNPQEDKDEILKLTGIGLEKDTTPDQEELDLLRAIEENKMLAQGIKVPVMRFDNFYIHFEQHTKHLKTDEARQYPQGIIENFHRHIEATVMQAQGNFNLGQGE